MSTDEQNLTLRRPSLAAPATSGLSITVLTTDAQLSAALKAAVAGRHLVFTVEDVEEAAAMATAGRCPILITDQALTEPALARITLPLRAHEPALVTIAVGNRGEDNALIGLLSAGAADRLMLKPVTSALARIVIDSAVREHRARKARAKSAPVPQNTTAVTPPLEVGEERSLPDTDESQSLPTEESRRPAKPMVEPEPASRLFVPFVEAVLHLRAAGRCSAHELRDDRGRVLPARPVAGAVDRTHDRGAAPAHARALSASRPAHGLRLTHVRDPATAVIGVMEHARLGKTTLVGHSFGGNQVLSTCAHILRPSVARSSSTITPS